ncbi:unnamed protein product, partial [Polarella glacialis]
ALQALLLSNRLLEDLDARLLWDMPSVQEAEAPLGRTTLRQLRSTGLLGRVGDGAQDELLSSTLYEYSASATAIQADPSARSFSGSSAPLFGGGRSMRARSARGLDSTSTSVLTVAGDEAELGSTAALGLEAFEGLRLRLERLLTLEPEDGEEELWRVVNGMSGLDSSVCSSVVDWTAQSTGASADSSFVTVIGPGDDGDDADRVRGEEEGELSRLLEEQLNSALSFSEIGSARRARNPEDQGSPRSVRDPLDETSAMWSEVGAGLDETARTVFAGTRTMSDDLLGIGGSTEGVHAFTSVLRRLAAADPDALDEALERSVRRVLEVGTVLSGARLSEDEIRGLPKVRFGHPDSPVEEQQCAICLEQFQAGDLLTELHKCRHFFHAECVGRWFQQSQQCPLCRRSQGGSGSLPE